jgi:hypothetical protein
MGLKNTTLLKQTIQIKTLEIYANYIQNYICNIDWILTKKEGIEIIKEQFDVQLTNYNISLIWDIINYRG